MNFRNGVSGWIPWIGGAQPVPDDVVVHVRLRSGIEDSGIAGDWSWVHGGDNLRYEIVAYRLAEESSGDDAPVSSHPAQGAPLLDPDLIEKWRIEAERWGYVHANSTLSLESGSTAFTLRIDTGTQPNWKGDVDDVIDGAIERFAAPSSSEVKKSGAA